MFFHMAYKYSPIFLRFCHNSRVWRTDGQTDRMLIARPRLHCMQRGKNCFRVLVADTAQWPSCRRVLLLRRWERIIWEMLHAVHWRLSQQEVVMWCAVAVCRWSHCPCGNECSMVCSRLSVCSQPVVAPTRSSTNDVLVSRVSYAVNTIRYALYAKQCNVVQTFSFTSLNISHWCPDWLRGSWYTTSRHSILFI